MVEAEKKTLGITHSEAGALLAKQWNFSKGLSEIIQFHHHPEKAQKNKKLAYIIYLSDLLMEKFNAGFDLEKMQTDSLQKALDTIGLTMADLPELIDAIPVNAINSIDNFT